MSNRVTVDMGFGITRSMMQTLPTPSNNGRMYGTSTVSGAMKAMHKASINSVYGMYGGGNSFNLYSSYSYGWGNSIDSSTGYRYNKITNKVEYLTTEWITANFHEYYENYVTDKVFKRRLDAEKDIIEHEILTLTKLLKSNVIEKTNANKPYLRKNNYSFKGYNGADSKRMLDVLHAKRMDQLVLQIKELQYKLIHLEEEHPEWLI